MTIEYTVATKTNVNYNREGAVVTTAPESGSPFANGVGSMQFENVVYLLDTDEGCTNKAVISKDSEGKAHGDFYVPGKWNETWALPNSTGSAETTAQYFGLWFENTSDSASGAESLILTNVTCKDEAGNDLGLQSFSAGCVITGGATDEPEVPTEPEGYTVTLTNAGSVFLCNKTPTAGPVTIEYTVATKTNVNYNREGAVVTTAPESGSPFANGVGSMQFENVVYLLDTDEGCTNKAVISKDSEGKAHGDFYVPGKWNETWALPNSTGSAETTAQYFGLWFENTSDSASGAESLILTNVTCKDAEGNDLGLQSSSAGCVISGGATEPEVPLESGLTQNADGSYTLRLTDVGNVFLYNANPVDGPVTIEYKVDTKTNVNYNREGAIVTTDPGAEKPFIKGVGSMQFEEIVYLLDTTAGCTNKAVISKDSEGKAHGDFCVPGKWDETWTLPNSTGSAETTAQYFGLWFENATPGVESYAEELVLTDITCKDEKDNNLELKVSTTATKEAVEYDAAIDTEGFVAPEGDTDVKVDGVALEGNLTKTGVHTVSYVRGGVNYRRTVTISRLGDAHADSEVNSVDLVNMLNGIEETNAIDALRLKCADLNNSGALEKEDASLFRKLVVGKMTAQEIKDQYAASLLIGAISDVHLSGSGDDSQRQNNYREALQFYKSRGVDVIVMNGDMTDLGEESAYDNLVSIFTEVYPNEATRPAVVATADNHEYYPAWNDSSALQGTKDLFRNKMGAIDTKLQETTEANLNTVRQMGGYTLIGVSEDYFKGGEAGFNASTVTWLDEQLAAVTAAEPDKPVFVAIHQPPKNTVMQSEIDGSGITDFTEVLSKYPQAVVLSGHTHAPLQDHRSIYQDAFTVLNTGTMYNYYRDEYVRGIGAVSWANAVTPAERERVSEGLLLKVTGTTVRVEAWDFWNNEMIREYQIDTALGAAGFQYTDAKQKAAVATPVFPDGATLTVTVNGTEAVLEFPSATNTGSFVHHYTVTVKDGFGNVEKTLYYATDYYNGISSMAKEQALNVTGLTAGTSYTFEVKAGNCFWEESEALK